MLSNQVVSSDEIPLPYVSLPKVDSPSQVRICFFLVLHPAIGFYYFLLKIVIRDQGHRK